MEVPEVSDVDIAFGSITHLPKWEDIPEEFKELHAPSKWNKLFTKLFYGHGASGEVIPKEGIDPMKAGRVIRAIMVSWAPKHEHKMAGCMYLMSQWFEDWKQDDPAI